MQQLSGLDTLFTLNEKRTSPMHIGALLLYEPLADTEQPLTFDQVYQVFADNLHKSHVFRRKLMPLPYKIDKPYWVEDKSFDLEQHIQSCSARGLKSPQELWQLVAGLHATGLDMKRPLWRATFIEDIDTVEGHPRGTTGLHIQIHHSAIDGMSGAAVLAAIHSLTPDDNPVSEPETQPFERAAPGWWLAVKASGNRMARSRSNTATTREIIRNVQLWRERTTATDSDRSHNKWAASPFNARADASRIIAVLDMPFAEVRAVRRTLKRTTVNHVVLCIVGGAMRRYLLAHEALPTVSLSACVPIDVRNTAGEDGGNVLSAAITALRTDIDEPLERLAAVREAAIEARESAAALGETTLLKLSSVLSQRTSLALLGLLSLVSGLPFNKPMPFNTVVSNVPGSPVDLYLAGARLSKMHAFGLLMDGMGLFHTASSYKDRLSITALGCPSSLPDMEFYQQCMDQSWQELRDGALG